MVLWVTEAQGLGIYVERVVGQGGGWCRGCVPWVEVGTCGIVFFCESLLVFILWYMTRACIPEWSLGRIVQSLGHADPPTCGIASGRGPGVRNIC